MQISPQFLQFFSLLQFIIPFLSLFLNKKGKIISIVHTGFVLTVLSYLALSGPDINVSAVFGGWSIYNGIQIKLNRDSIYFMLSASIVFLSVFIYSGSRKYDDKYFFLMELVYGTLLNLFLSNDLFNIYVCLELISLISYLLISTKLKSRQIWASLKYMILSAIGFNFYLMGIALIYRTQGTLNIELLASRGNISIVAVIFILMAFLIKSGAFMFSMWLPAAHSESEIPVSAVLSAVIVKAGIFCLVRINFMYSDTFLNECIIFTGIISLFSGTVLAMFQKDIKLILAFSTMSQVGYILMGINGGAAEYAFCHSMFKSSLFLISGIIYDKYHSRNLDKIASGKEKLHISVPLLFSVAYFAIIGMPFFAGFSEKKSMFQSMPDYFVLISLAAAFGTMIYLGRILLVIIPKSTFKAIVDRSNLPKYIAVSIPSFFIILIGITGTLSIPDVSEYLYQYFFMIPLGLAVAYAALKKLPGYFPSSLFNIPNIVRIYVLIIAFFMVIQKIV